MGNIAEKHNEDSAAQLADAEISRILTALNTAEFKRSEQANARPDQNFKPRSLMEIAEAAQEEYEAVQIAEKTIGAATIEASSDNVELQLDQVNSDDNRQGDDTDLSTDKADTTTHLSAMPTGQVLDGAGPESAGSLDTTSSDAPQPPLENSSGGDESPATDVSGSGGTGQISDKHQDVDQKVQTSPFETAQAAYDRGYIDGGAASREKVETELRPSIEAEIEAKLAEKIDAFESALTALAEPQTSDINSLSLSLQAAVVKLAAARAGTAIDALPELMLTRIQNLADAAGKNVSAGHIYMHPDDCAVIAPIMATRQDQVKIEADPSLYRGDVRIRFDGIDINDIADFKADWKFSPSVAHGNSAEVETFQIKTSDAELETQTNKNFSPNSQDVSVQSSITPPPPTDVEEGKPLIGSPEENEGASPSEAIGLMPLTTTVGDDPTPDVGTENDEAASSSEAINLMPLTTTVGDDSTPDGRTENDEAVSPSEAISLMPLTTTVEDDSTPDGGTENDEGASPSEAIGLMPLTSKDVEE